MSNSQRDKQIRQWAMFIHFSLLANLVAPYAGLIAPVIIWQIKKNDLPEINAHGKVVVNWIISLLIYVIVCIALIFILSGLILSGSTPESLFIFPVVIYGVLALLLIFSVVFSIVGGIKANNGKLWKYPFSFPILK